jgi:hypothetical protein
MPTVVKTVLMIEVVKMAGRSMKAELVKRLGGPSMAEGQRVVKEEELAVMGEVVAVTGEVVEAVVAMEIMGVVVEVVKEAKAVEEEGNQEVMVENPLVVGAAQWNRWGQIPRSYLSSDVHQFQKNHLYTMVFHPSSVQKHLPFQAHHPHPPRCNDACHLEEQYLFLTPPMQGLYPLLVHHQLP